MLRLNLTIIILLLLLMLISCSGAAKTGDEPATENGVGTAVDAQNVSFIWPGADEAVDAEPILQWTPFAEAEKYRVIVLNRDTSEVLFDQQTMETNMPVTPPLPKGHPYTWTVQAQDGEDNVMAEVHSFFTVKADLEAVEPANGESVATAPTLEWEEFLGADSYQIILLDDDAYPPVVISDEVTAETSFTVASALEPGSYSWTVWAKDANGLTLAELTSQFMVEK